MTAFSAAMAFTVPAEAGYTACYGDPGNWTGGAVGRGVLIGTNLGVSAPVLCHWLGREATAVDMKALSAVTQQAIFAAGYWNPVRGDDLPAGVGLSTFDMQVNAGSYGARCLQQAIGIIPVDGWIGAETLAGIGTFLPGMKLLHLTTDAAKVVQSELGVAADGDIGPVTQSSLGDLPGAQARALILCAAMYDQHIAYYRSLPTFRQFGAGWSARAMARLKAAIAQTRTINA